MGNKLAKYRKFSIFNSNFSDYQEFIFEEYVCRPYYRHADQNIMNKNGYNVRYAIIIRNHKGKDVQRYTISDVFTDLTTAIKQIELYGFDPQFITTDHSNIIILEKILAFPYCSNYDVNTSCLIKEKYEYNYKYGRYIKNDAQVHIILYNKEADYGYSEQIKVSFESIIYELFNKMIAIGIAVRKISDIERQYKTKYMDQAASKIQNWWSERITNW